jgi:uncharacterized protein (TIGR03435 family)
MQPGGGFTATNITLGAAGQAYRFQAAAATTIPRSNVPGWISSDHFDIVAKADANVPPYQFPELIKSLLIFFFNLAATTESRELQVYALILARSDGKLGPGLRPASAECAATIAARGRGGPPSGGPGGPGGPEDPEDRMQSGVDRLPPQPGQPMPCGMMRFSPGNLRGGAPIAQLATGLSPWVNRIVVDKTGLTGPPNRPARTPDPMPQATESRAAASGGSPFPAIDPNGPSIFTAVRGNGETDRRDLRGRARHRSRRAADTD